MEANSLTQRLKNELAIAIEKKGIFIVILFFALLISACGSSQIAQSIPTVKATESSTPTIAATLSVQATADPAPTSLPPARFQNDLLRAGTSLKSNIDDECTYLSLRWNPDNALPGTVVAPIMFHSILPGSEVNEDPSAINADTFYQIIELAEYFGFETITSDELIGFLYRNEAIPQRSMLLIIDDRRPGTAEEYFLPILRANEWTSTLAWIVGDTDNRAGLWEWVERLNETGYFDIQAHGLDHNVYLPGLTAEEAEREIAGPISILAEHFGERPVVYVWPGGIYSQLGVEIAREAGYEIAFTVHSRGPILFNGIPQGDEEDPIGDPLMTLPRFWSSAATLNLDQSFQASELAQNHAIENYELEASWFAQNCGGELPALESFFGEVADN